MDSLLLRLPSEVLSLVTADLELGSIIRLGKLCGCSLLWHRFTALRGVTSLTVKESDAIHCFRLHSRCTSLLCGLTSVLVNCHGRLNGELRPWVHLLPSTLTSLKVSFGPDAFLRPMDPATDSTMIKDLRNADGMVPMKICDYFPRLRVLELDHGSATHPSTPASHVEYFFKHLPHTIIEARFTLRYLVNLDLHLPKQVLESLETLSLAGFNASLLLRLPPTSDTQLNICPSLTALYIDSSSDHRNMDGLSRFHQLQTLHLDGTPPYGHKPTRLNLPSGLTTLSLALKQVRNTEFLAMLTQLRTLRFHGYAYPHHQFVISFLPPTLTMLDICPETEVTCKLRCELPPSLERLHLLCIIDSVPPIHLPGLSRLHNLECPTDLCMTATGGLISFPASLRKLSLPRTPIPPHLLPRIPASLTSFDALVDIDDTHAILFLHLTEWSRAQIEAIVIAFFLPQLQPSICHLTVSLSSSIYKPLDAIDLPAQLRSISLHQDWFRHRVPFPACEALDLYQVHIGRTTRLPNKLTILNCWDSTWEVPSKYQKEELDFTGLPYLPFVHRTLKSRAIASLDLALVRKDQDLALPATLTQLCLEKPEFVLDSNNWDVVLLYPLLETAPRLTSLSFYAPENITLRALAYLPDTLTKLVVRCREYDLPSPCLSTTHFLRHDIPDSSTHGLDNNTRASSDKTWLPRLQSAEFENIIVPLHLFVHRLAAMSHFSATHYYVCADLFPQIPSNDQHLESADLFHLLTTQLLPPHCRPFDYIYFVESGPRSLSMIPSSVTSLSLAVDSDPELWLIKFSPFLPHNLISLKICEDFHRYMHYDDPESVTWTWPDNMDDKKAESFEEGSVESLSSVDMSSPGLDDSTPTSLPSTLTSLHLKNWSSISRALLQMLPAGLVQFTIEGGLSDEPVDPELDVLPPTLQHLWVDPDPSKCIEFLPRSLQTLTVGCRHVAGAIAAQLAQSEPPACNIRVIWKGTIVTP